MYTLKQDLQLFQNFRSNHNQLKSYGFGDPSLLETTNHGTEGELLKYPLMYVVKEPENGSGNQLSRSYTIYFVDKLTKGGTNYVDVLNDTERYAHDLLAFLKNGTEIGKLRELNTSSWNLDDFRDGFEDCLCGHTLSISLTQPFRYDKCGIPTNDTIPVVDGTMLYIFLDGTLISTEEIANIANETINITF